MFVGLNVILEGYKITFRDAYLRIDAFVRDIYSAKYIKSAKIAVHLIPERLRIINMKIFVKGNGSARFGFLVQTFFEFLL
jgi:hypothetical protein